MNNQMQDKNKIIALHIYKVSLVFTSIMLAVSLMFLWIFATVLPVKGGDRFTLVGEVKVEESEYSTRVSLNVFNSLTVEKTIYIKVEYTYNGKKAVMDGGAITVNPNSSAKFDRELQWFDNQGASNRVVINSVLYSEDAASYSELTAFKQSGYQLDTRTIVSLILAIISLGGVVVFTVFTIRGSMFAAQSAKTTDQTY